MHHLTAKTVHSVHSHFGKNSPSKWGSAPSMEFLSVGLWNFSPARALYWCMFGSGDSQCFVCVYWSCTTCAFLEHHPCRLWMNPVREFSPFMLARKRNRVLAASLRWVTWRFYLYIQVNYHLDQGWWTRRRVFKVFVIVYLSNIKGREASIHLHVSQSRTRATPTQTN